MNRDLDTNVRAAEESLKLARFLKANNPEADVDIEFMEDVLDVLKKYKKIADGSDETEVVTENIEGTDKNDSTESIDFAKLLRLTSVISSEKIREETRAALLSAPKYFRRVPASSSGKYHPKYALGRGGLVRHTIAVVKIADHMCNLEFRRVDAATRDKILAACFLHDTRKQGMTDADSGHTVKDHAKLASETIEDQDISRMVLSHMGQWGRNKPGNMPQFIVHLADYLGSRKTIEVSMNG